MQPDLKRVRNWASQAPPKPGRWPGAAVRNQKNEIDFRRGVVLRVTDLYVHVETEMGTLVKLAGESYAHYCENCSRTIPGNVTYRRSYGTAKNSEGEDIPIRFFCPYCGPDHLLRVLRPGDTVRLHYRFESDSGPSVHPTSGTWFAEVWEW
jgi:hypothetical protein